MLNSNISIADLPPELLTQICGFLSATQLSALSQTCRKLQNVANSDLLWRDLVHDNLVGVKLREPSSFQSFRELYIGHHPNWFIAKHKIWIGDQKHYGSLLIARFNPRSGLIEAFRLVASRTNVHYSLWTDEMSVHISHFDPEVNLHHIDPLIQLRPTAQNTRGLNAPSTTFAFGDDSHPLRTRDTSYLGREVSMITNGNAEGIFMTFMRVPRVALQDSSTSSQNGDLWPSSIIPSMERVRSVPLGETAEENARMRQWSVRRQLEDGSESRFLESSFRIRRWINFGYDGGGLAVRMGEYLTTYSTISPDLYTPTKEKPWRGIWVGDYGPHGCEFILILQPDDERGFGEEDDDDDDDDDDESSDASSEELQSESQEANHTGIVNKGCLRAIKLTGDPNVPRGEYSFVAQDIGPKGLVRIERQAPYNGCRVVRCEGHVAQTDFTDGMPFPVSEVVIRGIKLTYSATWIASELVMVSQNSLAHHWIVSVPFHERNSHQDAKGILTRRHRSCKI